MKLGRRPRCSSVTYRFRYAPLLAPCRRRILIATKAMLFRGQDTNWTLGFDMGPLAGYQSADVDVDRFDVPDPLTIIVN